MARAAGAPAPTRPSAAARTQLVHGFESLHWALVVHGCPCQGDRGAVSAGRYHHLEEVSHCHSPEPPILCSPRLTCAGGRPASRASPASRSARRGMCTREACAVREEPAGRWRERRRGNVCKGVAPGSSCCRLQCTISGPQGPGGRATRGALPRARPCTWHNSGGAAGGSGGLSSCGEARVHAWGRGRDDGRS